MPPRKLPWLDKLIFPVIIILITAIAGSVVGYFIQDRQFKQTTLFKAKFDLLFESRKDAVNLQIEFEKVFAQIKVNEDFIIEQLEGNKNANNSYCNEGQFDDEILDLQNIKYKVDFIESSSTGLSDSSSSTTIRNDIASFKKELGDYIICLNNRYKNCSISCSTTHSVIKEKLQSIVATYTKELRYYVEAK